MEGNKKSLAMFESLNLSPQLFINEVLNSVDDMLDDAFNFFHMEASKLLKIEGSDERSAELTKGASYIRYLIQSTLDQRMENWEEYCLRFCFHVPEQVSMPKADASFRDDLPGIDALTDKKLDEDLSSLRDKLTLVGKESAELCRELHALERQSLSSNQSAGSIDETLQLHKKHDATQMFQELVTMTSEFRSKLGHLKRRRMEETECDRVGKLRLIHGDTLRMCHGNGLLSATVDKLEEFLSDIIKS